jgi:hypothetical protein
MASSCRRIAENLFESSGQDTSRRWKGAFVDRRQATIPGVRTGCGRQDLIGSGCNCLIPAHAPKEAIETRRRWVNDPDHCHTVANPANGEKPGERGLPNQGYRPGRKMARRQDRHPKHKGGDSGARP